MDKFTEPVQTLNGKPLSIGEAMTLRVALESFAMMLRADGLGDDEHGKAIVKGYLAQIESLRAIIYVKRKEAEVMTTCTWSQEDEASDGWDTSCGKCFRIDDGRPLENSMKFCCFCGGSIEERPWEREEAE